MEFRLVLRGPLPPERRRANTVPKHAVRRALHPQLKALFQQHPLLRAHLEPVGGEPSVVEQTANQNRLGRFRFVPLVDTTGACALDVLILLREEPYRMFNAAGDIDGRVKTLLDGLRMPQQPIEIPKGERPSADEDPFYVLLEDDSLIYELNVQTDRLYTPLAAKEHVRDVVAVIRVRIKAISNQAVSVYNYGP
jgi:hypothetical protein